MEPLAETFSASPDAQPLIAAALAAGAAAHAFFREGGKTHAAISAKGDSVVTEADRLADDILRDRLVAAYPDAAWLSEETADDGARLQRRRVLIVDPIDGTRGFIRGDARWAVCAALIDDGRPVAAVVHAPALGETYAAVAGRGATLNGAAIAVSKRTSLAGATLAGPKLVAEALAPRFGCVAIPRIPSLAYRLVLVASGAIDIGLAGADAYDWDLAAADLILHEAGGALTDADGRPLLYNRPEPRHGALVAASQALHAEALAAARAAGHLPPARQDGAP